MIRRLPLLICANHQAPIVLCELLLDEKIIKEKQIAKNKNLFLRFTHENQKAQKYLMGGFEKTIESKEAALLARLAEAK